MDDYTNGVTDGYQSTVNSHKFIVLPEYAKGVKDGEFLRSKIQAPLADSVGIVTLESIIGFMKRSCV